MKKFFLVFACCVLCFSCSIKQSGDVPSDLEIESLVNFGLVSSAADLQSLGLSKGDTTEILTLVMDYNSGKEVNVSSVISKVKNAGLKKRLLLLSDAIGGN